MGEWTMTGFPPSESRKPTFSLCGLFKPMSDLRRFLLLLLLLLASLLANGEEGGSL